MGFKKSGFGMREAEWLSLAWRSERQAGGRGGGLIILI